MARPRDRLEGVGSLYQIHSPDQRAVKLGFASNAANRLYILQTGNPAQMRLRDEVSCCLGAEKLLHQMLKPLRIAREWYPDSVFFDMLMGDFWECLDDKVEDFCEANPGADAESFEAAQFLTEEDIRYVVPLACREFAFGCEDEEEPPPEEDEIERRVLEIVISMVPIERRFPMPVPATAPIGFQGDRN